MTQRPTWLGNFYGGNLGFLNYEVLTVQHIPRKELKCEAELSRTKWFDYRRLHPLQATYYFVKCYNEAYRRFHRKAINAAAAPFVRGIKEHDFLQSREKLTFWRLRQLCDRMGMRYDFFLAYAFQHHHRIVGDGKVYAPRPTGFVKNEELLADVQIAWEEQCAVSMQVARDPYYRIANYVGSTDQLAHEAFVIGQVKRRRVPQFALNTALYVYDAVRIEEALRQFEARIVEAAVAA